HHFANKEAIGLEAMNAFAQAGMELYMAASSELGLKPIERVHRQLEAMMLLARTHGEHLACMVGMLSQELSKTHDAVREASAGHMKAHVKLLADLLEDAKKASPATDFDAE